MIIETRASIDIARPVEEVFDLATDLNRLPEYMTKVGPIPGVLGVEMVDGQTPRAGARRRVRMSDRSTIGEEVVSLDRPTRHGYRWLNPPALPFSLIVRGAEADWRFTPAGSGTRIDWTYRFTLSTFLVYPMAALIVALFRRWMTNALERIARAAS